MGEGEARRDKVTRRDLRHDRHTVSLLTDHLVFSPKYRGKVLEGEVVKTAEEVVEKYIERQKGYYKKEDAIPVVVVDEEKEKTHKIGYITLHTKISAVTGPVP